MQKKEREEQIFKELKSINQSLEKINERESNKKSTSPMGSLLSGI